MKFKAWGTVEMRANIEIEFEAESREEADEMLDEIEQCDASSGPNSETARRLYGETCDLAEENAHFSDITFDDLQEVTTSAPSPEVPR